MYPIWNDRNKQDYKGQSTDTKLLLFVKLDQALQPQKHYIWSIYVIMCIYIYCGSGSSLWCSKVKFITWSLSWIRQLPVHLTLLTGSKFEPGNCHGRTKRHWYFWYVWILYPYWSRFTEVLYQFIVPADPSRVGEWRKAYEKLRGRCSSAQPAASVGGFDKQFLLCLQFLISTLQLLRGTDLWWHRFKGSWETEMHNRNDSWVWFNMFKSETVRSIQYTYIIIYIYIYIYIM